MFKQLSILIVILVYMFVPTVSIAAAPKTVDDCLEAGVDCEDIEAPPLEETIEGEKESGSISTSFAFNFIKMIIALLLVLALIYFILQFIKKRNKSYTPVQVMENVGGISLGTNKSLQIIRLGSKYFLVGVGDNVELLQEVEDEEVIATLKEAAAGKPMDFIQHLFANKKKNPATNYNMDFTETLKKELTQLQTERRDVMHKMKEKNGNG